MANIKNGAIGTVLTPPSGTSGTTVVLTSGHGARFDNPTVKGPFFATAFPTGVLPNPSNWEIVQITAISTDTFTIVRAQRGSTAQTWGAGWILSNSIMAEDMFTSSINVPETLSGTPNGVLTTFGLSQAYSMLWLFKNGVFMQPGSGNDYVLNTAGNGVTFSTAPATGTKLIAIGITGQQAMVSGSSAPLTGQTPIGAVNGINTTFTVPGGVYIGGTLEVKVNGIDQKRSVHYFETQPGTGTFTMSDAPLTGDDMMVDFLVVNSVYGNSATVGGIGANVVPSANTILPLDANGKFPLSTLLSGMTSVQTYTNTGTGGGTGYYMNLGGVKIAWGTSGTISLSGAQTIVASLPSGFFTTVQFATSDLNGNIVIGRQLASPPTTSQVASYFSPTGGGAFVATHYWFAMGV